MRNLQAVCVLLFALFLLAAVASASAQVGFVITFGPPALPVYEQPLCPGVNYIWTPGYWSFDYDYDDYFWVPGTWVLAPEPGLYWTPGYWAWTGDRFFFHEGYWAPAVGFYGGIDYGFGYFGNGYVGGHWDHDRFFYNRAVTRVNVTVVRNVYNTTVNNVTVNRVSYNGGNGGIRARPTPEQEAVARERHVSRVEAQTRQIQLARDNRELRASVNEGKPPIAATPEPGKFSGREVVRAREAGAPYHPPAHRKEARRNENRNQPPEGNPGSGNSNGHSGNVVHPRDLPPMERQAPPNTGNTKRDQKVRQQEEKLQARQERDRQNLEKKQEREDQKLRQRNADQARRQQMEQRHQQQTQQMEQRHTQQRQQMERRQPPERRSEARPPRQEHPN
jgi:hypothetical protein